MRMDLRSAQEVKMHEQSHMAEQERESLVTNIELSDDVCDLQRLGAIPKSRWRPPGEFRAR